MASREAITPPTNKTTMDLNDMTIGEAKEPSKLFTNPCNTPSPFVEGLTYLIRTVTMTWYGTVKSADDKFIILKKASWIADTGRFSDALKDAKKFNEVEPAPNDVFVAVGAIIDATEMNQAELSQK